MSSIPYCGKSNPNNGCNGRMYWEDGYCCYWDYHSKRDCPDCNGTGYDAYGDQCDRCNGTGEI